MSYINTKKAVGDYLKIMAESSYNNEDFAVNWKTYLKSINQAVTNEDKIVPTKIVTAIKSAIDEDIVLQQFHPVYGISAGQIIIDISTDTAQGHSRLADKTEQNGDLYSRTLIPEAIYKMQSVDHLTYLSGGAYIDWVLTELPKNVVSQLVKQILVGGVKNEDGTDFTGIIPISEDSITIKEEEYYQTIEQAFDYFVEASTAIDGTFEDKVLFLNPKDFADITTQMTKQQLAIFLSPATLGARIVTTSAIDPAEDTTFTGILVNVKNYLLGIASSDREILSQFDIRKNAQVIEARAYSIGSLLKNNSAYSVILKLTNPNLVLNPEFTVDSTYLSDNLPSERVPYSVQNAVAGQWFRTVNGEEVLIDLEGNFLVDPYTIDIKTYNGIDRDSIVTGQLLNTFTFTSPNARLDDDSFAVMVTDEYIFLLHGFDDFNGQIKTNGFYITRISISDGASYTENFADLQGFIKGISVVDKNELLLKISLANSSGADFDLYHVLFNEDGTLASSGVVATKTSIDSITDMADFTNIFPDEDYADLFQQINEEIYYCKRKQSRYIKHFSNNMTFCNKFLHFSDGSSLYLIKCYVGDTGIVLNTKKIYTGEYGGTFNFISCDTQEIFYTYGHIYLEAYKHNSDSISRRQAIGYYTYSKFRGYINNTAVILDCGESSYTGFEIETLDLNFTPTMTKSAVLSAGYPYYYFFGVAADLIFMSVINSADKHSYFVTDGVMKRMDNLTTIFGGTSNWSANPEITLYSVGDTSIKTDIFFPSTEPTTDTATFSIDSKVIKGDHVEIDICYQPGNILSEDYQRLTATGDTTEIYEPRINISAGTLGFNVLEVQITRPKLEVGTTQTPY